MYRRNAATASLVLLVAALSACAGPNPVFSDGGQDFTLMDDTLTCLPDNDGTIQQHELNFIAGLTASYRSNPPNTLAGLDARGQLIDGKLEWDFSSPAGKIYKLKVERPADFWFAKHFPTGDIAMGVTVEDDTLQVLQLQQDRVLLLGLASRKPDTAPGHTLMIYDQPVVAMRFPLRRGLKFSSTGKTKAGAVLKGLKLYTEDTYEIAINNEGVVRLPNLKLHRTLMIETKVTSNTMGGANRTTRQLQWFSECYGEVVRALSTADEKEPLFSKATELRRLSF